MATFNSPLAVAGLGTYLREVEVTVAITHQNAADLDLKLVSRLEFASGAVAMRYEPKR